jgi:hypothetical protein
MYTGSCFCKNITIELSAQPQAVVSRNRAKKKKWRRKKKNMNANHTNRHSATAPTVAKSLAQHIATISSSAALTTESPAPQQKHSRLLIPETKSRITSARTVVSLLNASMQLPLTDWTSSGSSLYGGAVAESGQIERVAVRAGIFDDLKGMQFGKPQLEIYTAQRLEWVKPIEGCVQFDGMLPSS